MNFLSWECSESVIVSTRVGEFESTLNFEDFLLRRGENFGFLHFGDNDRYHRYIAQRCISYGTICNPRNQCMYISLYLCLSYEWSSQSIFDSSVDRSPRPFQFRVSFPRRRKEEQLNGLRRINIYNRGSMAGTSWGVSTTIWNTWSNAWHSSKFR